MSDFVEWYFSLTLLDLYWILALINFVLAIVMFGTDKKFQGDIHNAVDVPGVTPFRATVVFIVSAAVCSLAWPLVAVLGIWAWTVKFLGRRIRNRREQDQQAREDRTADSRTQGTGDSDLRP